MHRSNNLHRILVITAAICLAPLILALVLPLVSAPALGGGNGGGGGGGATSAYTIIPLPSPDGDPNHYGVVERISDVGPAGEVYIAGWQYDQTSDIDRAYCWTVDADGNADVEDLSAWFWWHGLDVNDAGIICGTTNPASGGQSPAVLLPDGTFVVLQTDYSRVRLNNPDQHGIFQVVGYHVLWDVAIDGTILAATDLVDVNGTQLFGYDINHSGVIAGVIYADNDLTQEQTPAVGRFVDGQLQILTLVNPSPDVIVAFNDMQIDDDGNVLGGGIEPADSGGYYARAVVWPASGGAVDLVNEFKTVNVAFGNGIATFDGLMQVVGVVYGNSGGYPYLYASGNLSDLNKLAEGDEPWELEKVNAINSGGMMCGYGSVGQHPNRRAGACLLVPTN